MNDPLKNYYHRTFDKMEVPENLLDKTLTKAFQSDQNNDHSHLTHSRRLKPAMLALLITISLLGTAVVYASVTGLWSRGLSGTVHSDPDTQQEMIDQGFAFPLAQGYQDMAVTCSGVTITPNMILTDGKIAYVSFLIHGYDYEIGKEERPEFFNQYKDTPLQYIQDGNDPYNKIHAARIYTDGFYSDVTIPLEGMPYYSDGSPAEINADGSLAGRYRDENGNLEYIIKVMTTEGALSYNDPYDTNLEFPDSLYESILHIEFVNLGTTDPSFDKLAAWEQAEEEGRDLATQDMAGYKNIVYGTWIFDIRMPERDIVSGMIRTFHVEQKIENTDCYLKTVEISPLSVNLVYTTSRPKNKRGGDNTFELNGIRLKDGTITKPSTWDLPVVLYGNSEEERTELISLDQVIDPEQVEALLVNLYAYQEEIEIPLQ